MKNEKDDVQKCHYTYMHYDAVKEELLAKQKALENNKAVCFLTLVRLSSQLLGHIGCYSTT